MAAAKSMYRQKTASIIIQYGYPGFICSFHLHSCKQIPQVRSIT